MKSHHHRMWAPLLHALVRLSFLGFAISSFFIQFSPVAFFTPLSFTLCCGSSADCTFCALFILCLIVIFIVIESNSSSSYSFAHRLSKP
ncbi:hypothetical protein C8R42DRAFT_7396 [Lentinula raphanica]|nr:hypothetical protein C8R42DRAFT_7396 [Lentinula raphanica]